MLNALALLVALCTSFSLLIPVMKLMFAGVMMNVGIAIIAAVVVFAIVWVGPAVGVLQAWRGTAKGRSVVTGLLSIATVVGLMFGTEAMGLHSLTEPGRATGPKPDDCKPNATDATAVGRPCFPDGGLEPEADCPAGYFCLPPIVNRPDENACMIWCRHDCHCPEGLKCVHDKCVR